MNKVMREIAMDRAEIKNKIDNLKAEAQELLDENKIQEAKALRKEISKLKQEHDDLNNRFEEESIKLENEKKIPGEMEGREMERESNRLIKNAVYPGERISNPINKKDDLDFGKLVKGMTGKGWNNAQKEQEYYNMNTSGNEVVIPKQLSDYILDVARAKSALFGKIPVVPMDYNNLKVAIQTKDAEANFVNEGDLIPASDVIFDSVDLEGKTLAIYIPVTEQLLDSSNIATQLTQSVAQSIANALDKALIYGTGEKSILGLENIEEVEKITHTTDITNYDFVVAGTKAIKKANITPTHIAYNSDLASELEIAKTSEGKYLDKPKFMENYEVTESNNIKQNQAIVYDVNSLLLGINKQITISWGYTGNDFQSLKKGLRVHLRADMTPVRKDGVKIVNINNTVK